MPKWPRPTLQIAAGLLVSAGALALSGGIAAAAPAPAQGSQGSSLPSCPANGAAPVTLASVSNAGDTRLPCVPLPGQQLVIVVGSTPTSLPPDGMTGLTDPRIDTYAKRQAIRDQYRGRINETTFNDELGDGVSLEQALADAIRDNGLPH